MRSLMWHISVTMHLLCNIFSLLYNCVIHKNFWSCWFLDVITCVSLIFRSFVYNYTLTSLFDTSISKVDAVTVSCTFLVIFKCDIALCWQYLETRGMTKRAGNNRRMEGKNPSQKCCLHSYMADCYNPCSFWSTMH